MTHACKSNIEEGAVILVLRSLWTDVPLKKSLQKLVLLFAFKAHPRKEMGGRAHNSKTCLIVFENKQW